MSASASPPTNGALVCVETDKRIKQFKEGLINPPPPPDNDPCSKPDAFEKAIVNGGLTASGEVPAAISDEQVQITNFHLKQDEHKTTELMLCGAMDNWEAYFYLNQCLAIPLAQEGADLPKLMADLNKSIAESGKKFPEIADKIKKICEQVSAVKSAFDSLRQCINKVCNEDDKLLIKAILDAQLGVDGKAGILDTAINALVKQTNQAVSSVIQAASIHALNNVTGLDANIATLKTQAEQFKKDMDGNTESASKKTAEWQKKYAESAKALALAKGDFGKASTKKMGKEAIYCILNKTPQEMLDQRKGLLDTFKELKSINIEDPKESDYVLGEKAAV